MHAGFVGLRNQSNTQYVTRRRLPRLRAYRLGARGIDPEDSISAVTTEALWARCSPDLGRRRRQGDRDIGLLGARAHYYGLFIKGVIRPDEFEQISLFLSGGGAAPGSGTARCCELQHWSASLRDPETIRAQAILQRAPSVQRLVLNTRPRCRYVQFRRAFARSSIPDPAGFSHMLRTTFNVRPRQLYSTVVHAAAVREEPAMYRCTRGDRFRLYLNNFAACPATDGQLAGFAGKLNRGLSNGKARYSAIYISAEKPFTDQSTWGFTTALTLQRARSNVAMELNNDEFFNGPFLDTYGWNPVNGVPIAGYLGHCAAPVLSSSHSDVTHSGPTFAISCAWKDHHPPTRCFFGTLAGRSPPIGHRLQRPTCALREIQMPVAARADGQLRVSILHS